MERNNIQDSFNRELATFTENTVLNSKYRRKKLLMWTIRTCLAAAFYFFFWKYEWVRWSLFLAIPFSAGNLLMIFLLPWFLKRKIRKTTEKLLSSEMLFPFVNNDSTFSDHEQIR